MDLQPMEMDRQIEDLRDRNGISTDGWTPTEEYDQAVSKNSQLLKMALDSADDDRDRELSLGHYPFMDHDEDG